jgi:hypothetical protein
MNELKIIEDIKQLITGNVKSIIIEIDNKIKVDIDLNYIDVLDNKKLTEEQSLYLINILNENDYFVLDFYARNDSSIKYHDYSLEKFIGICSVIYKDHSLGRGKNLYKSIPLNIISKEYIKEKIEKEKIKLILKDF